MAKITGDQWTKLKSLLQLRGFVTEKSADQRGCIYKFGPAGTLLKNNIRRTWWDWVVVKQDWKVFPVEGEILKSDDALRKDFKEECLDHFGDIHKMFNTTLPFSLVHTGECFQTDC